MATIFKIRRDTASNWSTNNPTLAQGEMGLDLTNSFIKMGDGSTAWNGLGRFTQSIENVEDVVGAMVESNTETFISVTYDDSDGSLDFVVPVLDEDNLASDSVGHLATQQSIKAYVTASVSAGGGGDVTLAGTQTFTGAKTFTSAVTVALTGDVTGSATFIGAGNTASIATTIQPNSVALGTDTTGSYVATVTGGTGLTSTVTSGEGSTPTIILIQQDLDYSF